MANGEYIGSNSKIIKNLNMFVGTLPEIKSKELKGTISYLEFLFATDTKEFYIGSRNGKAVCFGTGNAVNEDVIRQIAKEASADELQNIKTALQSILSEEISDEVNGLTASLTDAIKLINDNQITLNNKLETKQNKLIAGKNIIIDEETNTISTVNNITFSKIIFTPENNIINSEQLLTLQDIINNNKLATFEWNNNKTNYYSKNNEEIYFPYITRNGNSYIQKYYSINLQTGEFNSSDIDIPIVNQLFVSNDLVVSENLIIR